MYNTTPYGVRRAHSFDSYDNLERWQAIREHRKQFLSTRAKFDKIPPSEPPPPPPRHSSKFRIIKPPSSSAVSQLIQNYNEEVKSFIDTELQNYSFKPQKRNENEQNQSDNDIILGATNDNDIPSSYNSLKIDRFQNYGEQNKFNPLESPRNVLKLTQSWQKFKSSHSVETNKESEQSTATRLEKQDNRGVNELPVTKKMVDGLGYEQPTFFKEINVTNASISPTGLNSTPSRVNSRTLSNLRSTRDVYNPLSKIEVSFPMKTKEPLKYNHNRNKETYSYLSASPVGSVSKTDTYPKQLTQNLNWKPKYSNEEKRRQFFESTLKTSADEENSDHIDNSSVYFNSVRPRRISTGSMHEPVNWRSQAPVTPTKAIVHNYSSIETTRDYRF